MSVNLFVFAFFLNFNGFNFLSLKEKVNNSSLSLNHGQMLGYFTFTDGGVAGISYKISPLFNSTNLTLYIFPMAYDPFSNMQQMRDYYSISRCKDYYRKAIYSVSILEEEGRAQLGRFSGGFSVAIILSNKYACNQKSETLELKEDNKDSIMDIEVNVFNGDTEVFKNHLSGSDMGMEDIMKILTVFHVFVMILVIYSMKFGSNKNASIMLIIQRVMAIIVLCHIIICLLLLSAYSWLSDTGIFPFVQTLAAEVLALLCRYFQLFIIIMWTLSSPRDFSRHITIIAQIIGLCTLIHILLTVLHYFFTFGQHSNSGCFSVWDCEPHIYSIGWGNPVQYYDTVFGLAAMLMNCGANVIASLFLLHLLKVGFRTARSTVRRSYISVFCSVSLLWFWSYAVVWVLSTLVVDYWQYKMVILLVTLCNMCGSIAILRVTRIKPINVDLLPSTIIKY